MRNRNRHVVLLGNFACSRYDALDADGVDVVHDDLSLTKLRKREDVDDKAQREDVAASTNDHDAGYAGHRPRSPRGVGASRLDRC